mgnify:CR=1 FL=1
MNQVIYKIINLVNDKFYVGSTVNKKVRFREHRKQLRGNRHHCKHLQSAWNKYGEEKFVFKVIEEVPKGTSLWEAEDRHLKEHFGEPYCYNSGSAAVAPWRGVYGKKHPNFGKPVSEKQRQAISKRLKDFYAEDIKNHPRFGKTHSEEVKAKISQKVQEALAQGKGGKFTPSEETRRKMSESLKGNQCAKGYKRTEKEKEAIKQRMLGNKNWLGKTHTEEAKEKMSKKVVAVAPDGEETVYVSITALRKEFGLTSPSVNNPLKSGKPISKGKMKGWSFKYLAPQA